MKSYIKRILYFLQGILFKIYFTLFAKPSRKHKIYYFSLCCIFKDEAKYFKEWIEYHKIVGVDHIYAYNNFSEDNYLEILQPYINEGYLTLVEWPVKFGQISAYEDCYNKYKDESYWLMFLDLDEFLCLKEEIDIKKWIKPYEKYPSIELYWLMFGTNGVVDYNPSKLVIEQFTTSWDEVRNVGKMVLNTSYVPVQMYHHYIFCWVSILGIKLKCPSINESKKFIFKYGTHKVPRKNSIQINHYWSKCLSEYVFKINKGDMFDEKHDIIRKKMDFFIGMKIKILEMKGLFSDS